MAGIISNIPPSLYGSIPAATPPQGVQPNLSYPLNAGPKLVIAASVFTGLAMVFFLSRIYTKFFIVKRWNWDDGMPTAHPSGTLSLLKAK